MSSLLSSIFFFFLVSFTLSAPLESSTEMAVEQTTISWVSNSEVRKHIDLINEFVRVREEAFSTTETTHSTDNEPVPVEELTEGIEAAQALIHKFFAIVKDLETKKKELEMTTTTTAAPTTPHRGFFSRMLHNTPLRKIFD